MYEAYVGRVEKDLTEFVVKLTCLEHVEGVEERMDDSDLTGGIANTPLPPWWSQWQSGWTMSCGVYWRLLQVSPFPLEERLR